MMALVIQTGSVFLALSLILNITALLVPYWVDWAQGGMHRGLWGECSCRWFFDHDSLEDFQGLEATLPGEYTLCFVLILTFRFYFRDV